MAQSLKRELGIPGAIALGLGSIVGAGVFVSTGIAAEIAGPAAIVSVAIALLICLKIRDARSRLRF